MNILIILGLVLVVIFLVDWGKKKLSLEKYHKDNSASFVAEVEEYARWAEVIFKAYCTIAGAKVALEELNARRKVGIDTCCNEKIELHKNNDGSFMPKIIVNRRGHLGSRFREVFDCFKNKAAIDKLKLHFQLPTDDALRFDTATRKLFRTQGAYTIHDNYYKSLYQILYLNVYLSLLGRQYNIGKSNIREDPVAEYHLIQETIKSYPWLSGDFRRY